MELEADDGTEDHDDVQAHPEHGTFDEQVEKAAAGEWEALGLDAPASGPADSMVPATIDDVLNATP